MAKGQRSGEVSLTTRVGSLELANPLLTASGTSGHGAELAAFFDLSALGAVVVKSLSAEPWPGNPPPRLHPLSIGMLNSVGLQGRGVSAWLEDELPALQACGATVIASIWGRRVADFEKAALLLAEAPSCVVAVEVNISCPNLEDRSKMFAHSPSATAEALAATAGARRPRWAKLSPNVADLLEIAAAAFAGGAESLTLINTVLALGIDASQRRPVLGAVRGGLSGPALGPVALRAVYDCREAFPEAAIVGVGGVSSGVHAIELLLAGANAVQVGSATLAEPRASLRVLHELERWCEREGVRDVDELIGAAQR